MLLQGRARRIDNLLSDITAQVRLPPPLRHLLCASVLIASRGLLFAEWVWTSTRSPSRLSCLSLEVCSSELRTLCPTQISSLGTCLCSISLSLSLSASVVLGLLAPLLVSRAEKCPEPEERFIKVLQYYLAGWHIKPKGVKKPCVIFFSVPSWSLSEMDRVSLSRLCLLIISG